MLRCLHSQVIRKLASMKQTGVSLVDLQTFGKNAKKDMSGTLLTASSFLARELPIRTLTCPWSPCLTLTQQRVSCCVCGRGAEVPCAEGCGRCGEPLTRTRQRQR